MEVPKDGHSVFSVKQLREVQLTYLPVHLPVPPPVDRFQYQCQSRWMMIMGRYHSAVNGDEFIE